MDSLNRAVELSQMAMDRTPSDHTKLAAFADLVGISSQIRYVNSGDPGNLEKALSHYKAGWNCQRARPRDRLVLAPKVAAILAACSNWQEASQVLQDAVDLLPAASPAVLRNADEQ